MNVLKLQPQQNMLIARYIISIAVFAILQACVASRTQESAGGLEDLSELKAGAIQDAGTKPSGMLFYEGRYIFIGSHFSRKAVYSYRELGFDLISKEDAPGGHEIHEWSLGNPTSFGVELICARNANEFMVSGTARDGKTVIERWVLPPQSGAWHSVATDATSAVGTPLALSTVGEEVQGSAWIPPSFRQRQAPARRSEVYRGNDFVELADVLVDPEGRFLILVDSGARSVFQLLLDGSGTLLTLAEPTTFPFLDDLESFRAEISQTGDNGRVYSIGMHTFAGEGGVVLTDPENDGLFDPPFWMTHGDMDETFPASIWRNINF